MNVDIRSQSFQDQALKLDFRNARAGHSLKWQVVLVAISTVALFSSFLLSLLAASCFVAAYLKTENVPTYTIGIAFFLHTTVLFFIPKYRFSLIFVSPFVLSLVCSLLFSFLNKNNSDLSGFFLIFSLGLVLAIFGVEATAHCIAFTLLACSKLGSFIAFLGSSFLVIVLTFFSANTAQIQTLGEFPATLTLLSSIILPGAIVGQNTINNSQSFPLTRKFAVFWSSLGGTSFYNLDLSYVDFTSARLAKTDLRATKLYRTCFRDVTGLDRSRVDNSYLDLEDRYVQKVLTHGCGINTNLNGLNLQGAFLQNAKLRNVYLIESNLNGADLSDADLRDSLLARAIITDVDFTGADLTGACIKDWSFNSETRFEQVICDYIYREYENDRPTDRYPADRNFEPGEFQSLFQKLTNAVELVFKDQVDWRALSFTFDKFRLEDDGLELELKGVEQRGDYWIVKVTHKEGIPRQEVEQKVIATYEDLRGILAAKDQQINRLMGIVENQTSTLQNQSEALKNYSTQPFGNIFNITGSIITNLAGSGHIEYAEAANQVRSIIAQGSDPAQMTQKLQQLLAQFQQQNVAITLEQQAELLRQLILSEAGKDEIFKGFLKQQEQQILQGMPPGAIASAIHSAIEQLG